MVSYIIIGALVLLIDSKEKAKKAIGLFADEDVCGIGWGSMEKLKHKGKDTTWNLYERKASFVHSLLTVIGKRTWDELYGISRIKMDPLENKKSIMTNHRFVTMFKE